MKITDEYLAIWAEQTAREAKRRSLSSDEELLGALVDEVQRLRKIFDDAGQGEHNILALIEHYQDEVRRVERDRDAYRAMLADLVAAMPPSDRLAPIVARARDLLKNGPTPAAREPVYRCGVCLDGNSPCPVIDPPGVTKWTCLACGRIVGSGKGANDE